MRIATWNINGIRARIDFVQRWLRERAPDVVGLQELKATDEQLPNDVFESLGYHVVAHTQKAWNGVAVLSREPAEVVQLGLPGEEDFGARLVSARLADLTFTTVYCPNGKSVEHPDFAAKLEWFRSLESYMRALTADGGRHVLCGDFNVVPTALDSWNEGAGEGAIFHTVAERDRFRALLDLGLVDVFRSRNPDASGFTWWDYRAGMFPKNRGLRIDALLVDESLAQGIVHAAVDRDWRKKVDDLTPSDHAPVYFDTVDR